jgi:N-acetylglutamate synthase
MSDNALNWRAERVCRAAWPALREVPFGDWVFRYADGLSRRANSANAFTVPGDDLAEVIAAAEAHYAAWKRPTYFRVTDLLDPSITTALAARGYMAEAETVTLYGDFVPWPMRRDPDVSLLPSPDAAWRARMSELKQHDMHQRDTYAAILARIEAPAAFAALQIDGVAVALAFGVLQEDLLCLESVITDPTLRGRGHARRLIGAMMAWAINEGANGVCLQVEADNAVAQRLYRNMGLTRELYRYRYWRAPVIRAPTLPSP